MKQRILSMMFALTVIAVSATAQSLSVQDIELQKCEQAEIVVNLSGGTAMTALQFNLQLPAGVTANTGNATLGTATDGHTFVVETLDSGDLLFVLYSMDLNAFKDGELLRIPVTAGNTEGTSQGKLYTVRTASISGDDAVSHACADASFAVKVKAPEPPITITANDLTMAYGDEVPTLTFKTEGGTLNGTPVLTTTATKTSPVGTYPITVAQGSVTNSKVTYVSGTLTITKAPLKITAGTYTKKQYDPMPEFTLTYEGFKNNETKDVLTKQPAVSCEANEESAPGEYDVNLSGAEATNYAIQYIAGKLIVTEPDSYALIYVVDGVEYKRFNVKYREAITPLEPIEKEGYTFSGWSEIPETMPANDVTVTGSFTINKYLVTFTADNVIVKSDSLTFGAAITSPNAPEKEGYTFTGWKPEVAATVPARDVTYEAEYKVNVYAVIYMVNNEEWARDSIAYGETIELKTYTLGEDEIFSGWTCEQDYTTMPAHDVVYTANVTSGIWSILANRQFVDVYNIGGGLVGRKMPVKELKKRLPRGIYIIEGRKVTIR